MRDYLLLFVLDQHVQELHIPAIHRPRILRLVCYCDFCCRPSCCKRTVNSHLFPLPDPKEPPPSDNGHESPRYVIQFYRNDRSYAIIPPICSAAILRQLYDRRNKLDAKDSSHSP
ncbi:hypothetical protein PUN28_012404 [Cardiocondyla obscurior]|uniref:Uncharacterized protein n=1 Tax=Cardiocondyla obscurior TaxID=286306 RepID=A0AAW2FCJ7_9HYME